MSPVQDLFQRSYLLTLFQFLVLIQLVFFFQLWMQKVYFHPLAKVPGPLLAKFTPLWQIYHLWMGDEYTVIEKLHRKYGSVVRVGLNTVDIADGAALGPIYVDKGGFLKTSHYHNFYVDGFPTIFSSTDPAYRATKAKLVAPMFSNAAIRQGSDIINQCVDRFVSRIREARESSTSHSVELQEPARLLGLDVLASYLFRRPHPAITAKARGSDLVLPWLNAFVDVGQFYYIPSRWFGYLVSLLEKWRPDRVLEAESANAVDEYAISLSSNVDNNEGTFQGRLLSHGFSVEEVAAESKDVTFAGLHSFGSVLATTLWCLAKDAAV